ncbi:hypothetical protein SDC9_185179 [bioreactor metagenome]|uniref:Uncharacterized protein n=1 Tax=bioreactor metagenome TaxID=1076179 RepID=A0A645HHI4_9ZZZZ
MIGYSDMAYLPLGLSLERGLVKPRSVPRFRAEIRVVELVYVDVVGLK